MVFIILLLPFLLASNFFKQSTKNWERGFNNVWLDKENYDINAKCKLKQYWFPNYDVGAKYLIYPFFKTVERDCQKVLSNEEYIFYDENYNPDIENNNY